MPANDVSLAEHEPLLDEDEDDVGESGEAIALEDLTPRQSADSLSSRDALENDPIVPANGSIARKTSGWTADEERKLVRKLDCLVMPLLIIAFFALQLDRGMRRCFG